MKAAVVAQKIGTGGVPVKETGSTQYDDFAIKSGTMSAPRSTIG